MPDENVSSADQIGAVLRNASGEKDIVMGLTDSVDSMLCGESVVVLDEIKRYIDELRDQKKALLKDRGVMQAIISKRDRKIKIQESEIQDYRGRLT